MQTYSYPLIYVHGHTFIHMQTCLHAWTYKFAHRQGHKCRNVHIFICTWTHSYIHFHTPTCLHDFMCLHIYSHAIYVSPEICSWIHSWMHVDSLIYMTYIYTLSHTEINSQILILTHFFACSQAHIHSHIVSHSLTSTQTHSFAHEPTHRFTLTQHAYTLVHVLTFTTERHNNAHAFFHTQTCSHTIIYPLTHSPIYEHILTHTCEHAHINSCTQLTHSFTQKHIASNPDTHTHLHKYAHIHPKILALVLGLIDPGFQSGKHL